MQKKSNENKSHLAGEDCSGETGIESSSGEECVKKTHSLLRDVHKAIFNEQVVLFFFWC
jgi:mediator of RNA polymerase II transcription subunit 17